MISIPIDRPEARIFWPRLVAALSEMACAAWLAWVWCHPERAGLDGVLAGFGVVALEGPLLVGLIALFAAVTRSAVDLPTRLLLVLLAGFAIALAVGVSVSIVGHLPGGLTPYLLSVLAGSFIGKWMLFLDGRRNPTWFEIGKVIAQGMILVVCVSLATSFAPRVGFDVETMARLHIPEALDMLGQHPSAFAEQRDGRLHATWGVIAGGAFYFAVYGVFRFLTFTQARVARVAGDAISVD